MSTQEVYTERQWTKEETDLLPFGYKPNKILIADSDPDTVIYNATWYNDPVLALDPTGPWALIKQGEENEQVTLVHWEQAHPGITHVNVDNWHTLEGTFNGLLHPLVLQSSVLGLRKQPKGHLPRETI
jgi:hypothetical protein